MYTGTDCTETVICSGFGELAVLKAKVEMQPPGGPIGKRQLQADQIRGIL